MFKTQVNKTTSVDINNDQNQILGSNETVSVQKMPNNSYNIILAENKFIADIVDVNEKDKLVKVKINQQLYQVSVQDSADILLQKVGVKIATEKKTINLKSPMPGLVLQVLVKEGQQVKKGDALLVVEAMKMENIFKANTDAVIDTIKINEKQVIEKGQELITFK
jgi:biotin carboxyl carrier protein